MQVGNGCVSAFVFAALLTFADGRYIGAILDCNGLRPARYYLSTDDILYMSSEVGVTDIQPEQILHKVSADPLPQLAKMAVAVFDA